MSETSVLDAIKAESNKFTELTTEGGGELSDLIAQANELKANIENIEEKTKSAKTQLNKYLFELIPAKIDRKSACRERV